MSLGLIHKHFGGMSGLLKAADAHSLSVTTLQLDAQLAALLLDKIIPSSENTRMNSEAAVYLKRALTVSRQGSDALFSESLNRYVEALTLLEESRGLMLSQPIADCAYFLLAVDIGLFALAPLTSTDSNHIDAQVALVRNALLARDSS